MVFILDKRHFLFNMGQDLHSGRGFLAQFVQFVVALLDLLVQRLVFDLQLLEVDQMQTLGQLLLCVCGEVARPSHTSVVHCTHTHTHIHTHTRTHTYTHTHTHTHTHTLTHTHVLARGCNADITHT